MAIFDEARTVTYNLKFNSKNIFIRILKDIYTFKIDDFLKIVSSSLVV